jgi:ABC-type transporter Mla MlaB component
MSATKVELPAAFKIDGVDAVYQALKNSLSEEGSVEVDGGTVETVDFAALQLLMVFAVHCTGASREFSLTNVSEALGAAIKDVGAGEVLSVA